MRIRSMTRIWPSRYEDFSSILGSVSTDDEMPQMSIAIGCISLVVFDGMSTTEYPII